MKKEIDVITLITTDEYANMGGRYIIDPKTGRREIVVEATENGETTQIIDNEEEIANG